MQDDGEGFDVSQTDAVRFGLRGMRERAELIGAHLQINSVRGRGTVVKVVLELPDAPEESEEKDGVEDTRARSR